MSVCIFMSYRNQPGHHILILVAGLAIALAACRPADSGDNAKPGDAIAAEETLPSPLIGLSSSDTAMQLGSIDRIDREWHNRYAPALIEYISLGGVPSLQHRSMEVLRRRTGQDFGYDLNAWFAWAWRQEFRHGPDYAEFKSRLYAHIDPRFARYFSASHPGSISLDEIRWGGVRQDGIPPLRQPAMIAAAQASYLADTDIVFGLEVNGDIRAYPKRILAWHEMFVDTVGGIPVVGVYCTLCGSMILYESTVGKTVHQMGTSGFLFRSNKLMYDRDTQSLWNTMWGKPVVGPLADSSIRLPRRTVVTTTWGEWRRRHPQTSVLSLDTGHQRDYSEGAAYRDYFSSDKLMFNSSLLDERLPNKAEVLGLAIGDPGEPPLAIAVDFGRQQPLIHERVGSRDIVVLTDRSGAMRAYATRGLTFDEWDGDRRLRDSNGKTWALDEDRLHASDGETLERLPSNNAFWFGWYGAYSNTRLIY